MRRLAQNFLHSQHKHKPDDRLLPLAQWIERHGPNVEASGSTPEWETFQVNRLDILIWGKIPKKEQASERMLSLGLFL